MSMTRFEAILNLMFLLIIAFAMNSFTVLRVSEAQAVVEDSRGAQDYEMDEYETCIIIDQKPEAECDKLFEVN